MIDLALKVMARIILRYSSTLATAVTAYPANLGIENEPTSSFISGTFFPSGGGKEKKKKGNNNNNYIHDTHEWSGD